MDAPEVDGVVYVKIPKEISVKLGQFVTARITEAKEYDLLATFLKLENS